mgnify:FL=1
MTIISIDVSRREKERKELRLKQKKLMDINLVEKTSENYKVVSNASNDKKMVGLLQKVRQSDAGVDEDFARFNGSHLYTQSIGKTQNKRKALLKENIDKSEKDYPTQLIGNKPRKRIIKKKVLQETSKSKNKEITWNYICEQLGHQRFVPSTNTLFGGLRNTSATYLKETI